MVCTQNVQVRPSINIFISEYIFEAREWISVTCLTSHIEGINLQTQTMTAYGYVD